MLAAAYPSAYVEDAESRMLWMMTPVPVGSAVAPLASVAVGCVMSISLNAAASEPCSTTQSANWRQSGTPFGDERVVVATSPFEWLIIVAVPLVVDVAATLTEIESPALQVIFDFGKKISLSGYHSYQATRLVCFAQTNV
jgi:hypothetical protein